MYVTCPGCKERIRNPVARLSGIQVQAHVNKSAPGHANSYCKVVIVIDEDFAPPRVLFVQQGESIERIFQREQDRILALRKAREN